MALAESEQVLQEVIQSFRKKYRSSKNNGLKEIFYIEDFVITFSIIGLDGFPILIEYGDNDSEPYHLYDDGDCYWISDYSSIDSMIADMEKDIHKKK